MLGNAKYLFLQALILFFFRMYRNVDIVYNRADVGLSLCCNYGIGRVYLPSTDYLLFREDYERTYFIAYGTGGILYFDNSHCFGFNFTLLVVRIDNNFVTSVQPTVNCSDPSYNVISENNLLTVNITNITNQNSNSDESDRYVVFRNYHAENSSVVVTLVEFFIFNKFLLNNVTITKCINTNTGYHVPIYNPITLNCIEDCVFLWYISNFIYYTFIYHEGSSSDVKCVLDIK